MKGVIRFVPVAAFYNPNDGLSRSDRNDRLEELYTEEPGLPHDYDEWLPLNAAIKRPSTIVVEAKSPAKSLFLRFVPSMQDCGAYRVKRMPRGDIEEGRTTKVIALPADLERFKIVGPYQYRFLIGTLTNLRPYRKHAWILGFSEPVEAPDE